jgi:hypothetical protein
MKVGRKTIASAALFIVVLLFCVSTYKESRLLLPTQWQWTVTTATGANESSPSELDRLRAELTQLRAHTATPAAVGLSRSQVAALSASAGFFREGYWRTAKGEPAIARSRHASWHSFASDSFEAVKNETWEGTGMLSDELRVSLPLPAGRPRPIVLLIGDSTDRDSLYKSGFCEERGKKDFYLERKCPYDLILTCEREWGVIEAAFTYGAAPRGPYHLNLTIAKGSLVDTERRLPALIASVVERRGRAPDVVVYQAILWSIVGRAYRGYASSVAFLQTLMRDYARNVDVLQELLPNSTLLLRTQSLSRGLAWTGNYSMVPAVNAGVRLLGAVKHVGVLDWAMMLQGVDDEAVHDASDLKHYNKKFSAVLIEAIKSLTATLLQEPRLSAAELVAWEKLGLPELGHS